MDGHALASKRDGPESAHGHAWYFTMPAAQHARSPRTCGSPLRLCVVRCRCGHAQDATLTFCAVRDQMRSERIIEQQVKTFRMRTSLRAWRLRVVWRVVWKRVGLRTRRCVCAAWRHSTATSVANRRVARKGYEVRQVKLSAQAWHRWELRLGEQRITDRHTETAVRAALRRSARMLVLGILLEWRGRAAQATTDAQVDMLTVAVESYEQALKDVGIEKSELLLEKVELEASVATLSHALQVADNDRQNCTALYEAKLKHLQAQQQRATESSLSWKSRLDAASDTLSEAHGQTEHLRQQLEASQTNSICLADELAAKESVANTLQQRVQDLLVELSNLDERFRSREAQAAEAESLKQRLKQAGSLFEEYQRAVVDKLTGHRSRLLVAFAARHSLEHTRRVFSEWLRCVNFRARVIECERSVLLDDARNARRVEWLRGVRARGLVKHAFGEMMETCRERVARLARYVQKSLDRRRRNGLSKALYSWIKYNQSLREQHRRVGESFRMGGVNFAAKVFLLWRQAWVIACANRSLQGKLSVLFCRMARRFCFEEWFRLWQTAVRVSRWRKAGVVKAEARKHSLAQSNVLSAWRNSSATSCRHKKILRRVVVRLRAVGVLAAFCTWSQTALKRRRAKVAALRVVAQLRGGSLARSFRKWCDVVAMVRAEEAEQAKMREVSKKMISRMKNVACARAFHLWWERCLEAERLRNCMERVLRYWCNTGKAAVMARWRGFVAEVVSRRVLVRKVVGQWTGRSLSIAMTEWRQSLRRTRTLSLVLNRMVLRFATMALETWHCNSAHARRIRLGMRTLSRRQGLTVLYSALQAWQLATMHGRCIRKLIDYTLRKLKRVWIGGVARRWQNRAKEDEENRGSNLLLALRAHSQRQTATTFSAWILKVQGVQQRITTLEVWSHELLRQAKMQNLVSALSAMVDESSQSRLLVEAEADALFFESGLSESLAEPSEEPDEYKPREATDVCLADSELRRPMVDKADDEKTTAAATAAVTRTIRDVLSDDGRSSAADTIGSACRPTESREASDTRIPLSAIRVLSQVEAIWKQISEGRRRGGLASQPEVLGRRDHGVGSRRSPAPCRRALSSSALENLVRDSNESCASLSSVLGSSGMDAGESVLDPLPQRVRCGDGGRERHVLRGIKCRLDREPGCRRDRVTDREPAPWVARPSSSAHEPLRRLSNASIRARFGQIEVGLGEGLR